LKCKQLLAKQDLSEYRNRKLTKEEVEMERERNIATGTALKKLVGGVWVVQE